MKLTLGNRQEARGSKGSPNLHELPIELGYGVGLSYEEHTFSSMFLKLDTSPKSSDRARKQSKIETLRDMADHR